MAEPLPLPLAVEDFVARVVEDGIEDAVRDYGEGTPQARGSVAGFEACRSKDPPQLAALLDEARSGYATSSPPRSRTRGGR